jgi:hypothetical protein
MPAAAPATQAAPQQGDGQQQAAAPKKQGLGAALGDKHIARRFIILAYTFLVMCMVSASLVTVCCKPRAVVQHVHAVL